MISHYYLGNTSFARSRKLIFLIAENKIVFGGNVSQKIYGTLKCKSGKRLKIKNRIFFSSKTEAIAAGYRPCGNCMKEEYKKWKAGNCI